MYRELFNGYNCLSAALGEYSLRKGIDNVLEVINSQMTFLFDKDLFWKGEWFAGSTLKPVDSYLIYDLKKYLCGYIYEKRMSLEEEVEYLKENDLLIVLVDFYYMDSVNWKLLKRFNIIPEHDPHFILTQNIDTLNQKVNIIDPYYNYIGEMDLEKYKQARSGITRQGEVDQKVYLFTFDVNEKLDIKTLFFDRMKRYYDEKMFENIFTMGEEIDRRRLIYGINQDRKWAINAYNCLRSAMDQHERLNFYADCHKIEISKKFIELENLWGELRKKFIEYYNYRLDDLEEISYLTFKIGQIEKNELVDILSRKEEKSV